MKAKTEVKFSKEEQEAIKLISNIDCFGIRCAVCPFNLVIDEINDYCVRGYIKDIAKKEGFYENN